MKVVVVMRNGGKEYRGKIKYKDDSYLFLNIGESVRVLHWDLVKRVYRELSGGQEDVNISKYGNRK